MTRIHVGLRRVVGWFGFPLLLVVGGLCQAGCSVLGTDDAASRFSRQNACPDKRMSVKSVQVQPEKVFVRPSPPAGITDDPKKLAAWEKRTDADFQQFRDLSFFDVSGCGVRHGYLCWKTPNADGSTLEAVCPFSDGDRTPATNFGRFDLKPNLWPTLRARTGGTEPTAPPGRSGTNEATSASPMSAPSPAVAASSLAPAPRVAPNPTPAPEPTSAGKAAALILDEGEGERRVWRPLEGMPGQPGPFTLKFDPRNGSSSHLVLITEDLPPGGQITPHKHPSSDEIIFLQKGKARVTVGDTVREVSAGASVLVPAGTWIAINNIGSEAISAVFVFSAPGFEDFMRAESVPEGQRVAPLSKAEDAAIMKHFEQTVVYKDPS